VCVCVCVCPSHGRVIVDNRNTHAVVWNSNQNDRKLDITCTLKSDMPIFANFSHKKHLKNVGPIRYCEPPHAHSPDVASGRPTVARRLRIDVHDNDDNDNA